MGDENRPPSFTITLREVWDELVKLGSAVAAMSPQAERIESHAKRLRRIERWMYTTTGFLLATCGTSVAAFFHH